jgi:hypothetical protein
LIGLAYKLMSRIFFVLIFNCLLFLVTEAQTLPAYTISACDPGSKEYYFCSLMKADASSSSFNQCHIIFNRKGEILYYRQFRPGQFTGDFKLQPNGLISFFFNDKFYLMDSTFSIVDSVYCKNGALTDNHEFQLLPNGHYILLGSETTIMDLSRHYSFKGALAGSAKANVKCGVIQEQDAMKNVVFEWRSKNYFDFDDVDPYFLPDTLNVDWMHVNAVARDTDGNYLVSLRYFNEVIKISRSDGKIMWRLGGKHNQFEFINDPQKFIAQHDIRRIKNGHITLFDNGRNDSDIHPATAKEYELDEKSLKVRLVWNYVDNPKTNSKYSGSVQRLANGNTLVNYGSGTLSRVLFNVVKPSGKKVFEIIFKDSIGTYRTYAYENLPWALKQPEINTRYLNGSLYLDAGEGYEEYTWSTGEKTQKIQVKNNGSYFVFVPDGKGGFISSQHLEIKDF